MYGGSSGSQSVPSHAHRGTSGTYGFNLEATIPAYPRIACEATFGRLNPSRGAFVLVAM
jgi:hypothetical protein